MLHLKVISASCSICSHIAEDRRELISDRLILTLGIQGDSVSDSTQYFTNKHAMPSLILCLPVIKTEHL